MRRAAAVDFRRPERCPRRRVRWWGSPVARWPRWHCHPHAHPHQSMHTPFQPQPRLSSGNAFVSVHVPPFPFLNADKGDVAPCDSLLVASCALSLSPTWVFRAVYRGNAPIPLVPLRFAFTSLFSLYGVFRATNPRGLVCNGKTQ